VIHHGGAQTLLRHVKFEAQTMPHPPQLFRSNAVFTQVFEHSVRPMAQVHTPLLQPTVPMVPWQTVPHEPQLRRSFCRSRQMPLQLLVPTGHWQLPATQNWPTEQVRPHWPQLARSLWRSRQMPLHTPKPPLQ
jgi:hypothetical protein